jgi:hypothetical protein
MVTKTKDLADFFVVQLEATLQHNKSLGFLSLFLLRRVFHNVYLP